MNEVEKNDGKKSARKNEFSLGKYVDLGFVSTAIFPAVAGLLIVGTLLYNWVIGDPSSIRIAIAIVIAFIAILLAATIIIIFVVLKSLKIIKVKRTKELEACQECASDYKKFIFMRHDLVCLDEIIKAEKNLALYERKVKREVLNYTTLCATDPQAHETITRNKKAGVSYTEFCVDQGLLSEHETYGEESLIDCTGENRFFTDAQFDYLLMSADEWCDGYIATCFLSRQDRCSGCKNREKCCYKKRVGGPDKGIVYKRLTDTEKAYVKNILHRRIALEKKKREEEATNGQKKNKKKQRSA